MNCSESPRTSASGVNLSPDVSRDSRDVETPRSMPSSGRPIGLILIVAGLVHRRDRRCLAVVGDARRDAARARARFSACSSRSLILVAPLVGGGIFFLTRGRAEEKASERVRNQRRLLDMLMTRGQLSIVDVALELGTDAGADRKRSLRSRRSRALHRLRRLAQRRAALRRGGAAARPGQTCPNCGGELELAGKGLIKCPYCGAEIFLGPAGARELQPVSDRRHLRGRKRPVTDRPEEIWEQRIREALDRVPGYRGYRLKEERRDADRRVRAAVADAYAAELARVERIGRDLANARRLGEIAAVERTSQAIRHYIDRVRSATPGYGGLFGDRDIDGIALDQLRLFDEGLLVGVDELRPAIDRLEADFAAGQPLAPAADEAARTIESQLTRLNTRQGGDRDRTGRESRQRARGAATDRGGHPARGLLGAARGRDLDPG